MKKERHLRSKKRHLLSLLTPPEDYPLSIIVDVLNYPEHFPVIDEGPKDINDLRAETRRLVRAWQDSGPNVVEPFRSDKELAVRCAQGQIALHPTRTGRAFLVWRAISDEEQIKSMKNVALLHFIQLIAHSDWQSIGGPCKRCDKYYLSESRHKRVYCSAKCRATASAVRSTRHKRLEERDAKLARAKAKPHGWRPATRMSWKQWVSQETRLSLSFLTLAEKQGELVPPRRHHLPNVTIDCRKPVHAVPFPRSLCFSVDRQRHRIYWRSG